MPTQTQATAETEAAVLASDDRRFAAMLGGDFVALEAALADDLTYVHSTARLESKAEHLENLRAGKPHYRGIRPHERRVRMLAGAGIIDGMSDMHVERDSVERRFTIRYLAVYVPAGDQWKLLAWQSTSLPE